MLNASKLPSLFLFLIVLSFFVGAVSATTHNVTPSDTVRLRAPSCLPGECVPARVEVVGICVKTASFYYCAPGSTTSPSTSVVIVYVYTATSTFFHGATATTTKVVYNAAQGSDTTVGAAFLIVLILGPGLMFGGYTKSVWGAIFGAALGAAIGAIPEPQGPGLVPFYFVPLVVVLMLGMIFLSRRGEI
jgi:hypothetical protein